MVVRVLVFDENPLILEAFEEFFRKENYRMISAQNLQAARQQLQQQEPHLIILNVNPQSSEWKAFLDYRKQHFPHIPILGITAFPELLYQKDPALQGIDAMCLKPFEIKELRQQIRNLLACHRKIKNSKD